MLTSPICHLGLVVIALDDLSLGGSSRREIADHSFHI
jgi:hypothetical protein